MNGQRAEIDVSDCFTVDELRTIEHGLRIAAEVFSKDAAVCRQSQGLTEAARRRLGDQFDRQAEETLKIADRLGEYT